MDDVLTRVWEQLIGRVSGPMSMRLFLQPLMASILAIRDGLKDAREGQPAYFWSLFTDRAHRGELLRQGWKSVGKIFIIAVILDAVYQGIVFRRFYPGEALITAGLLALVPYILLRGPVNRIARRRYRRRTPAAGHAD